MNQPQLLCVFLAALAVGLVHGGEKPSRLTDPKGSERWSVGSKHPITWDLSGVPASTTVQIEVTTDDGKSWQEVVKVPTNGRFLWQVPDRPSAACKIRVSAHQQPVAESAFTSRLIFVGQQPGRVR